MEVPFHPPEISQVTILEEQLVRECEKKRRNLQFNLVKVITNLVSLYLGVHNKPWQD